MIWAEAEGCRVVDVEGRTYLDLTGGFGVAALGHRNAGVVAAVTAQADRCLHALGDLAEADVAAQLRVRLGGDEREVMLGVTGEDAVEIALPTAASLATGLVGRAEIRANTGERTALVPIEAIVEADGERATVFVVDSSPPRARRVAVNVTALRGDQVGVRGPLGSAHRVVSEGSAYLDDGMAVRVVP